MGDLLYLFAVILVVVWAIGFIGYNAGGALIHILLAVAVLAVILRIVQGRPVV